MNAASWSPTRVHDVVGESAIYYQHHDVAQFIVKRLQAMEC
jgi:hypothetical protein